jgi:hypothetical protein
MLIRRLLTMAPRAGTHRDEGVLLLIGDAGSRIDMDFYVNDFDFIVLIQTLSA